MPNNCDIGLIGLAVMGENLALNIESRGFSIAVYNRTTSKVDELLAGRANGKKFVGCHSMEELVDKLSRLLSRGDVIIDGGNTNFMDTEKRTRNVEARGMLYIGTGISGG